MLEILMEHALNNSRIVASGFSGLSNLPVTKVSFLLRRAGFKPT
jgi:hypothetical protein